MRRSFTAIPHTHTSTGTEEPAELCSGAALSARKAVHVGTRGEHQLGLRVLWSLVTRMRNNKNAAKNPALRRCSAACSLVMPWNGAAVYCSLAES
jgi:hypothetical protein